MNSIDATVGDGEALAEEELHDLKVGSCIRNHALAAAAGGLIPIPIVDLGVATAAQIRMIAKLSDIYGIPFSEQAIKSTIGALLAAALPRVAIGYPVFSVVRSVPVVGQILGIATLPVLYGAVTWALGRAFAWHFARGGTLRDADADALADRFGEELKKAKGGGAGAKAADA
jgi:uncharacterized protein (DUF697 family)